MSKILERLCHILVTPADGFSVLCKILDDKFKNTRGATNSTYDVVRLTAWNGTLRSRPRDSYAKQLRTRVEIRHTPGGSNVIQAEEYDYGCVDDGAEDIDEGSENGTEDALGPEDGERKGDDDPCTVG
ncbi:predicted protein [Postia placenta Mad-698-R]|uniref:Uncharacterized protein n=1 Tax=Postia placenta MAD-698-R-SB12 TaxID=670580 RepID=A0A1X6NE12_9APHY|nr:hypothetical protein POSPLADRAFT_1131875 [Postia placenta MAD-698-R-SB12]EED79415.1 predicted protein [Postia placenta Mad-698-R]OSX66613.1 hypothetical protein POSPLADRAFT_1131875 [Postia placenta MAD-698-R-SB12]